MASSPHISPTALSRKNAKRETVTLLKPHTHRGVEHQPGDKLELWPDQIERLRADGTVAASTKPNL
jgi:hypothetical protein